jgi:uncharacterized MAPEG superfamily protein
MTIAFWCVLIVGLLPIAATGFAKLGAGADNKEPRAWLAKQTGFRARAYAAQLNSFEAIPLFAAAVIIAHVRGAPADTVDKLAIAFVVLRIVYIGLYVANLDKLRSAVWFLALGCTVALFFV